MDSLELREGNAYFCGKEGHQQDEESQRAKLLRDSLNQLLKMVESRMYTRTAIFGELLELMLRLDMMVDFSEFLCFYDFVFFICRGNGQKNITVSRAVAAWRLVLAGRFRLLNQRCDFVEKYQRHNISEDTWQHMKIWKGAWPVIIDDFVEHMYRISGCNKDSNDFCSCGDSESQSCAYEDSLPGIRGFPGLKTKLPECGNEKMESLDSLLSNSPDWNCTSSIKRSRLIAHRSVNRDDYPPRKSSDDCVEAVEHSSPMGSSKSLCAVEGLLPKGFAGLFSSCSLFAV